MKKIMVAILSMLVLGTVLCQVGLMLGGHLPRSRAVAVRDNLVSAAEHTITNTTSDTASETTASIEEATTEPDPSDVRNVELHLGRGNFYIMEANEHEDIYPFTVAGDVDRYEDTFTQEDYGTTWNVDITGKSQDSDIYLYLPAQFDCNNFELEFGSGNLTATYLQTYELEIEVGTGMVNLQYVDTNHLEAEVSSGSLLMTVNDRLLQSTIASKKQAGTIKVNNTDLTDNNIEDANVKLETQTGVIEITS